MKYSMAKIFFTRTFEEVYNVQNSKKLILLFKLSKTRNSHYMAFNITLDFCGLY